MKTMLTTSCLMIDDTVARSPAIEVGSALETSQNLHLFNEKGNEVHDLLQKFELLHNSYLINSRK